MIEDQIDLITEEGESVTFFMRSPQFTTTGLICELKRTESPDPRTGAFMRMSYFTPSGNIQAGELFTSNVSGKSYLTLSAMEDIAEGVVLKTVHVTYMTNALMTIQSEQETADNVGNITNSFVTTVSGLPVYIQMLADNLQEKAPGLIENINVRVYSPPVSGSVQDRVQLFLNGSPRNFTIQSVDDLTYGGVYVFTLLTDERS